MKTVNFVKLSCRGEQRTEVGSVPVFVDLSHVDLFTSSTSTWAGLTAKLLLKDRMVLCPVEKWEVQAVSNILSVS